MCEGTVTEPGYIRGFSAWRRNPLVEVRISDDHGVPRTLVEAAKKALNQALLEAQTSKDDNLSFDEVWCVFDVDDHPDLKNALEMARNNNIRVALSNPCFELWLLLHFRESPGAQTRQAIQKLLKNYLPNFNKHVQFDELTEGYAFALQRARRLQELADDDEESTRNPTTTVYRLMTAIG